MTAYDFGASPPTLAAALQLPPVIGHRGAAARAPENTLAGMRAAKALGCAWVEFDVRLTADGALVLCHDTSLDRTTDRSGPVAGQSLAMIRQCDAGSRFGPGFASERVPTLDEALALAVELDLGVNIEVKDDSGREYAAAAAVADTIKRPGPALPLYISSFLPAAVAALRELAPLAARGILFRTIPRGWQDVARRCGCAIVGADHRRLRPRRVAEVREAGYAVAAYTVNDPARAQKLFAWGVTSVFSDMPDIILQARAADELTRPTLSPPEAGPAHQGAGQ